VTLSPAAATALDQLHEELRQIFGARLRALVAYGAHLRDGAGGAATSAQPVHSLALVESLAHEDLQQCASRAAGWVRRALAVPLLLTRDEFTRSLDAFPIEYGDILAHHVVVAGASPFEGLSVAAGDLRRACEVQAKSHVIHLREGYIEAGGSAPEIARLIAASAPAFAALLTNVLRLQGVEVTGADQLARFVEAALGLPATLVRRVTMIRRPADLPGREGAALFPEYLDASARVWRLVDSWKG
jgi:hypothetical protein